MARPSQPLLQQREGSRPLSQVPELLPAPLAGQGALQPRVWVGTGTAKVKVTCPFLWKGLNPHTRPPVSGSLLANSVLLWGQAGLPREDEGGQPQTLGGFQGLCSSLHPPTTL